MGAVDGGGRGRPLVLVTGAGGYLGSVLTEQLLERGYRVRALDLFLFGEHGLDRVRGHPGLEIVRGDARDLQLVEKAVDGAAAAVCLASLVGEAACDRDPRGTVATNHIATLALAEACHYHGVERLLFASTDSAYGIREGIMLEESPCNPLSLYARLKLDTEQRLLALPSDRTAVCVLRQATLYGLSPRMRFDLIINILTLHAVSRGKFTIFGGKQWRPLVHVADSAAAFVLAIEAPLDAIRGQVFNVGSNEQNVQIYQLGDLVGELIPEATRETTDVPPDLRDYHVSFDKISRVLGFRASRTIADGVVEIRRAIERGQFADPFSPGYRNA
jgi:nucleoside-diphosphate-sugar epimerase